MQRFSIIHPGTNRPVVVVLESDVEKALGELPSCRYLRQIIQRLERDGIGNVGIVYNLHHGHEHIDRFPALWRKMQAPALTAVSPA